MFEAYKVGVSLSLTNQVSGILGFIARDFIKTEQAAAVLQSRLKEIKLLGMSGAILGGAGFLGLGLIRGALKPAEEYAHQLNIMNMAGLQQKEIAEAIGAAWKNTGDVMNTTATGNLKALLDLRNVMQGGLPEALKLLPIVTKIQTVMAASSESKISSNAHDIAFNVAKALDVIGAVKNPEELEKQAGMMSKVITAMQNHVTPQQFQSVFTYARQAKFDMSDEFKYEILPSLMLEVANKGGGGGSRGVGPMLAAMYRVTNQGFINKKALPELTALGLVDPTTAIKTTTQGTTVGAMKGADQAAANPYKWVNEVVVPAIKAKYGDNVSDQFIRQELNQLFRGNQLAAAMAVEFYTKQGNFLRDQKNIRGAMGYQQAFDTAQSNDPVTAMAALDAQWENLKTAAGVGLVPIVIPALRGLTSAFNALGGFLHEHPRMTQALAITFGGLSALAVIGGTLMIAGAGIKVIGLAFGAMNVLPLGSIAARLGMAGIGGALSGLAALPLVSIAVGITAIGAALAGILYHREIAGWIDEQAPGIGDTLLGIRDYNNKKNFWGGIDSAPRNDNKPVVVHSTVNLDGRKVGSGIGSSMSGPSNSGSAFDGRQSYIPSYMPFAP